MVGKSAFLGGTALSRRSRSVSPIIRKVVKKRDVSIRSLSHPMHLTPLHVADVPQVRPEKEPTNKKENNSNMKNGIVRLTFPILL